MEASPVKLKMQIAYAPAIPAQVAKLLRETLSQKTEQMCARERTQNDMARLFTKVRNWKQPKRPPTLEWIAKLQYRSTVSSV